MDCGAKIEKMEGTYFILHIHQTRPMITSENNQYDIRLIIAQRAVIDRNLPARLYPTMPIR